MKIDVDSSVMFVYEQIMCEFSNIMVFDLLRKEIKPSDFLILKGITLFKNAQYGKVRCAF